MFTTEQRFQAAVNVIKGLPKNGPYQPSTTMMLQFYGYYKQATEGPCMQKKPAFWDIVGKAKWDAWNSNRHLTREQAMQKYVDQLREIIETMSFTENVAEFVGTVSGLENINLDEVEMVAPGVRQMAESHPNSPFNSRTNSPQHNTSSNTPSTLSLKTEAAAAGDAAVAHAAAAAAVTTPLLNGHLNGVKPKSHLNHNAVDSGIDLNDGAGKISLASQATNNSYATSNGTVDQSDDEYGDPIDFQRDLTDALQQNSVLLQQIQATVLRMNADMVAVNQRMTALEKGMLELRSGGLQKTQKSLALKMNRNRFGLKWWPFEDISPAWFALLVLWPFLLSRLSRMLPTQRGK